MTSTRALALLLALGAVWGSTFLFIRVAVPEFGPVTLTFLRVAIAAAALVLIARRPLWALLTGPRRGAVAFIGLTFSAIPFTLISISTGMLSASFAAILNATTPLFTVLIGAAWLGRALRRDHLVGIALASAGVLLIVGWSPLPEGSGGAAGGPGIGTLVAVLASLGAAASYAVAGSFLGRYLHGEAVVPLAAGQLLTASVVLAIPALASLPPQLPSPTSIGALLALALLGTALPWPVFLLISRWLGATGASTVTFLVPAFGVAWAVAFLGEPLGIAMLPGAALIAAGLVLVLGLAPRPLGIVTRPVTRPAPTMIGNQEAHA